ncbi:MAG: acyltransferase, partial [Alphaproteobacteria bacterium]|nr:acyltransferase [Alphaproteobacteria bacterium]
GAAALRIARAHRDRSTLPRVRRRGCLRRRLRALAGGFVAGAIDAAGEPRLLQARDRAVGEDDTGVRTRRRLEERVVKYRPDVDGLRAVAVLSVLAFHAFPSMVRGGFVGVDVFFVISGFLISGIIFSGLQDDRFSFSDFYARRIRRIFPALVTVLAATYAAGWFLLFADRYGELGKHIAGGAGFISNLILWREAGYFDGASDSKPLLHLWSLGIEEQFYLLWPFLAWLTWKGRIDLLAVTLAVFFGSMYFNLDRIRRDLIGTFYAPQTRFWELMAGAALAHIVSSRPLWSALTFARAWYLRLTSDARARSALSVIGALAIAVSVFGLDESTHFPGRWAIPPVAGAVLIIAAGPDSLINRWLSSRVMVAIGLISYPLYLWHWPILSFLRVLNAETPAWWMRTLAVAASFALAWATYQFIETPIRFGQKRRFTVAVLCLLMTGIGVAGYYTWTQDGLWSRAVNRGDRAHFEAYYRHMRSVGIAGPYRVECDFMQVGPDTVKDSIPAECTAPGRKATWFVWGDSHAQALVPGLTSILPAETSLAQVTTSSCRPAIGSIDPQVPGGRCEKTNRYAIERIAQLKPEVVILAQAAVHIAADWEALAAHLRSLGAQRVIVVGPVPMWLPTLPEVVTSRYWGGDWTRVNYGLAGDRIEDDRQLRA